jgi:hypothetical protein
MVTLPLNKPLQKNRKTTASLQNHLEYEDNLYDAIAS